MTSVSHSHLNPQEHRGEGGVQVAETLVHRGLGDGEAARLRPEEEGEGRELRPQRGHREAGHQGPQPACREDNSNILQLKQGSNF